MENLLSYGIFKYLWVVILMPKTVQFVILFLLSFFYLLKSGFSISKVTISFLMFIFVYLLAIIYNLIVNQDIEVERVLAAVNVVGMWILSLIAYCYYYQNKIEFSKVKKYMFINMTIMIIFSILFIFIRYQTNIYILGRPLAQIDWLSTGQTERFSGFLEYANLISFFYLLILPLSLLHIIENKKIYFLAFTGLSFIPIIASNSRVTLIAILFAMAFLLFFYLFNSQQRTLILVQLLLLSVMVFILYSDEIGIILYDFFNARSGSNALRFMVYEESLRLVFQRSPFIGLGIRESFSPTAHLGTHSTYVGIIFRTGIIGAFFFYSQFLTQIGKLINKLQKSGYISFLGFIIAFLVVIMFEDIDGSNWVLYMLFIYLGMICAQDSPKPQLNIEKLFKQRRVDLESFSN